MDRLCLLRDLGKSQAREGKGCRVSRSTREVFARWPKLVVALRGQRVDIIREDLGGPVTKAGPTRAPSPDLRLLRDFTPAAAGRHILAHP